jgi:hypothetical protein
MEIQMIPTHRRVRVIATLIASTSFGTALASVQPEPKHYLGFASEIKLGVVNGQLAYDVYVDAVAPDFGSLALGVAAQGPYTLVGSKGDATPIVVDGAGRVICVPPAQ